MLPARVKIIVASLSEIILSKIRAARFKSLAEMTVLPDRFPVYHDNKASITTNVKIKAVIVYMDTSSHPPINYN
jgi:hypothetical protein